MDNITPDLLRKIASGLEICDLHSDDSATCDGCQYKDRDRCIRQLKRDICRLADWIRQNDIMRESELGIKPYTLDEIQKKPMHCVVYIDLRYAYAYPSVIYDNYPDLPDRFGTLKPGLLVCSPPYNCYENVAKLDYEYYGITWRAWPDMPTKSQREARWRDSRAEY